MNCPRCTETMDKVRLDVYGCVKCGHRWLIHPYRAKKHPQGDERKE